MKKKVKAEVYNDTYYASQPILKRMNNKIFFLVYSTDKEKNKKRMRKLVIDNGAKSAVGVGRFKLRP